jgi:hypothetical protein
MPAFFVKDALLADLPPLPWLQSSRDLSDLTYSGLGTAPQP